MPGYKKKMNDYTNQFGQRLILFFAVIILFVHGQPTPAQEPVALSNGVDLVVLVEVSDRYYYRERFQTDVEETEEELIEAIKFVSDMLALDAALDPAHPQHRLSVIPFNEGGVWSDAIIPLDELNYPYDASAVSTFVSERQNDLLGKLDWDFVKVGRNVVEDVYVEGLEETRNQFATGGGVGNKKVVLLMNATYPQDPINPQPVIRRLRNQFRSIVDELLVLEFTHVNENFRNQFSWAFEGVPTERAIFDTVPPDRASENYVQTYPEAIYRLLNPVLNSVQEHDPANAFTMPYFVDSAIFYLSGTQTEPQGEQGDARELQVQTPKLRDPNGDLMSGASSFSQVIEVDHPLPGAYRFEDVQNVQVQLNVGELSVTLDQARLPMWTAQAIELRFTDRDGDVFDYPDTQTLQLPMQIRTPGQQNGFPHQFNLQSSAQSGHFTGQFIPPYATSYDVTTLLGDAVVDFADDYANKTARFTATAVGVEPVQDPLPDLSILLGNTDLTFFFTNLANDQPLAVQPTLQVRELVPAGIPTLIEGKSQIDVRDDFSITSELAFRVPRDQVSLVIDARIRANGQVYNVPSVGGLVVNVVAPTLALDRPPLRVSSFQSTDVVLELLAEEWPQETLIENELRFCAGVYTAGELLMLAGQDAYYSMVLRDADITAAVLRYMLNTPLVLPSAGTYEVRYHLKERCVEDAPVAHLLGIDTVEVVPIVAAFVDEAGQIIVPSLHQFDAHEARLGFFEQSPTGVVPLALDILPDLRPATHIAGIRMQADEPSHYIVHFDPIVSDTVIAFAMDGSGVQLLGNADGQPSDQLLIPVAPATVEIHLLPIEGEDEVSVDEGIVATQQFNNLLVQVVLTNDGALSPDETHTVVNRLGLRGELHVTAERNGDPLPAIELGFNEEDEWVADVYFPLSGIQRATVRILQDDRVVLETPADAAFPFSVQSVGFNVDVPADHPVQTNLPMTTHTADLQQTKAALAAYGLQYCVALRNQATNDVDRFPLALDSAETTRLLQEIGNYRLSVDLQSACSDEAPSLQRIDSAQLRVQPLLVAFVDEDKKPTNVVLPQATAGERQIGFFYDVNGEPQLYERRPQLSGNITVSLAGTPIPAEAIDQDALWVNFDPVNQPGIYELELNAPVPSGMLPVHPRALNEANRLVATVEAFRVDQLRFIPSEGGTQGQQFEDAILHFAFNPDDDGAPIAEAASRDQVQATIQVLTQIGTTFSLPPISLELQDENVLQAVFPLPLAGRYSAELVIALGDEADEYNPAAPVTLEVVPSEIVLSMPELAPIFGQIPLALAGAESLWLEVLEQYDLFLCANVYRQGTPTNVYVFRDATDGLLMIPGFNFVHSDAIGEYDVQIEIREDACTPNEDLNQPLQVIDSQPLQITELFFGFDVAGNIPHLERFEAQTVPIEPFYMEDQRFVRWDNGLTSQASVIVNNEIQSADEQGNYQYQFTEQINAQTELTVSLQVIISDTELPILPQGSQGQLNVPIDQPAGELHLLAGGSVSDSNSVNQFEFAQVEFAMEMTDDVQNIISRFGLEPILTLSHPRLATDIDVDLATQAETLRFEPIQLLYDGNYTATLQLLAGDTTIYEQTQAINSLPVELQRVSGTEDAFQDRSFERHFEWDIPDNNYPALRIQINDEPNEPLLRDVADGGYTYTANFVEPGEYTLRIIRPETATHAMDVVYEEPFIVEPTTIVIPRLVGAPQQYHYTRIIPLDFVPVISEVFGQPAKPQQQLDLEVMFVKDENRDGTLSDDETERIAYAELFGGEDVMPDSSGWLDLDVSSANELDETVQVRSLVQDNVQFRVTDIQDDIVYHMTLDTTTPPPTVPRYIIQTPPSEGLDIISLLSIIAIAYVVVWILLILLILAWCRFNQWRIDSRQPHLQGAVWLFDESVGDQIDAWQENLGAYNRNRRRFRVDKGDTKWIELRSTDDPNIILAQKVNRGDGLFYCIRALWQRWRTGGNPQRDMTQVSPDTMFELQGLYAIKYAPKNQTNSQAT